MTSPDNQDGLGQPNDLARTLVPDLTQRIFEVVVESFNRWAADGFRRFGDHERHFTAVLIGYIRQVAREKQVAFRPIAEYLDLTPEMLSGEADPMFSPRIDIGIWWDLLADDPNLTIECKRLGPGLLARAYVFEGMRRFAIGQYARSVGIGGMLAYVIAGESGELHAAVNEKILDCPEFGKESDKLESIASIAGLDAVFQSNHVRSSPFPAIMLSHLFFDIKDRPPVEAGMPTKK